MMKRLARRRGQGPPPRARPRLLRTFQRRSARGARRRGCASWRWSRAREGHYVSRCPAAHHMNYGGMRSMRCSSSLVILQGIWVMRGRRRTRYHWPCRTTKQGRGTASWSCRPTTRCWTVKGSTSDEKGGPARSRSVARGPHGRGPGGDVPDPGWERWHLLLAPMLRSGLCVRRRLPR